MLEIFQSHSELVLNSCRVLSKLSLSERFAELIVKSTDDYRSLRTLVGLLPKYPEIPHITTRVCFILANAATSYSEARRVLGKSVVAEVLEWGLQKNIGKANRLSPDVLVKSLRLIANLVLDPEVGQGLDCADSLVSMLGRILSEYDSVVYEELVLNAVSCLTNVLYYDTPQSPFEINRFELLSVLAPLLVQTLNTEITIEAVRACGNLTRHEEVCKAMYSLLLADALLILLEHSDNDVVFYSLGCLTNVSCLAKELLYSEMRFTGLISALESFQLNEPELSLQVSMVLVNLCSASKGLVPWESVAGEEQVNRLASLAKDLKAECEQLLAQELPLADLDSVLEVLLEAMPRALLPCPVSGCGRKFPSEDQLTQHIKRRH